MAEALYPGWGQRFRVVHEFVHRRTKYQDVLIFESASHGRVLVLDGAIQVTEADEFVYQEMLSHVPLMAHGAARNVLIVGGGDGGVLRRVLQHKTVERAVMVEIDGEVIDLVREHLPGIAADAWSDPRAEIIVGDGLEYVAEAPSGGFDVVIVDSTDPVSVGEALFTEAFYADCARALGPGGIVVNQAGVPFMQGAELKQTSRRRSAAFMHVSAYVAAVPTYVGGFMALGFAAKLEGLEHVPAKLIAERAAKAGILGATRYWSPDVHEASFKLPPYIAAYLNG